MIFRRKRKVIDVVDPRSPKPRLASPGQAETAFGPRSFSEHDDREPVPPRLIGFGVFIALAFALLGLNMYGLQVQQNARYRQLAEGNRVRRLVTSAPRGIIFDRHGVQLVTNTASFAVAVVPIDLPQAKVLRADVLARLQKATGLAPQEVERQVRVHTADKTDADAPFRPIVLKENLDATTYQVLTENLPQMPGVKLPSASGRHYVTGIGLSHLLGYVGALDEEEYNRLRDQGYLLDDRIGKSALEFTDEKWLRGTEGVKVVETDARGNDVQLISKTDPVPGNNVYLTLDLGLQRQVAAQLQATMDEAHKKFGGNRGTAGAAIVMNPQSGEIYSMVSLPDYDINWFAQGITVPQYQSLLNDPHLPLLNRAIDGQYPPGSTFKPVTASAALQSSIINANTNINCPGFLSRGSSVFHCWNLSGHGNQNVIQAIAHSCDVFFYTVADQMGDLILNRFAKDFGVGRRTGIDLPAEAKGIAPDRNWKKIYFAQALQETGDTSWRDDFWYEGNTITYGIGQSYLLTTPLQDLEWTATVANGGNFMRPQVTGNITAVSGAPVRPFKPILDHKVAVAPEALAIVREGLRAAVNGPGGTASLLNNLPQPAAAKTGSAQYGLPDAKGDYPIHGWFTAYAPASDPEVAIVVFVEGGGEGHEASMPAAQKILQYYFAHRDEIRAGVPKVS